MYLLKDSQDKTFIHESRMQKRQKILEAKISDYIASVYVYVGK